MRKSFFHIICVLLLPFSFWCCRCLGDECINSQSFNFYVFFSDKNTGKVLPINEIPVKVNGMSVKATSSTLNNIYVGRSRSQDTLGVSFSYTGLEITHKMIIVIQDTLQFPITITLNKIEKTQCCSAYTNEISNIVANTPNSDVHSFNPFQQSSWKSIIIQYKF